MSNVARLIMVSWLIFLLAVGFAVAQDDDRLDYGDTVSGVINDETAEINYTFEGTAGDIITITMVGLNPENISDPRLDSFLTLIDPAGTTVMTDDDGAGNLNSLIGPITLAQTGTYTIVAARFMAADGGSSGAFELTLETVSVEGVTVDEPITIELTPEDPAVFLSYPTEGAEILEIVGEVTSGDTPFTVTVTDSNGGWLNQGYSLNTELVFGPVFLPEADVYGIEVAPEIRYDANGQLIGLDAPLTIAMSIRSITSEPIDIEETQTGLLNDENPSAYFTFLGSIGQTLSLSGAETSDSQPLEIQVFSPDGFSFNSATTEFSEPPGTFSIDPLQLTFEGEYLIVVRRAIYNVEGVSGTTSEYEITLGSTQTPLLENGVEVTAVFDFTSSVFERVYRYMGTEGESIRITLRSINNGYGPGISIQGPNADIDPFVLNLSSGRPATISYEFTLNATGEYIIRITNSYFNSESTDTPEFGLLIETVEDTE